MRNRQDVLKFALAAALVACGGPDPAPTDGGIDGASAPRDAGDASAAPVDSGLDAGPADPGDAGLSPDDAGALTDAVSDDAGAVTDAAPDDGGTTDAAAPSDAASMPGGSSWVEVCGGRSVPEVAVDADGNVLAVVPGEGTFTAGGVSFALGYGHAAIVSWTAGGSLRFARAVGTLDSGLTLADVAPDGAGGMLVTGTANGAVDLGGGFLAGSSSDVVIARFDATGAHVWSRRFGGGGAELGTAVAVGSGGAVYVGGLYETIDLGGGSLPPASGGGLNGYVASLDALGAHRWSRGIPSSGVLALDVRGDALGVAIQSFAPIDLGGGTLAARGSLDAIAAVLDAATGAHRWAVRAGGAGYDRALGIVLDDAGGAAVVGTFAGSATFGAIPLVAIGAQDAFVARFGATGTVLWARAWGTVDLQAQASDVAFDSVGGTYVVGGAAGTIDFGGGPRTELGASDGFLVHLDASGGHLASELVGSALDDVIEGVALDAPGAALILGGTVSGDFHLDGSTWTTIGAPDGFVARLAP